MAKMFVNLHKPTESEKAGLKVSHKKTQHRVSMGRKYFALALVMLLLCISFILTGCDPSPTRYYGEYPEAFTMATNSLLGASGDWYTRCWLIDQDEHGRAMYCYENPDQFVTNDDSLARCAILISQKTEDGFVYYYPDYNFISCPVEFQGLEHLSPDPGDPYQPEESLLKQILEVVSEDDLERLKNLNDWNKPFDKSKCIRLEVVHMKNNIFPVKEWEDHFEEIFSEIHPDDEYRVIPVYLTSDNYDRHILLIRGSDKEFTNYSEAYVLLLNPDGTYDLDTGYMEMTDLFNYQDALKAFKEQNHWNEPL